MGRVLYRLLLVRGRNHQVPRHNLSTVPNYVRVFRGLGVRSLREPEPRWVLRVCESRCRRRQHEDDLRVRHLFLVLCLPDSLLVVVLFTTKGDPTPIDPPRVPPIRLVRPNSRTKGTVLKNESVYYSNLGVLGVSREVSFLTLVHDQMFN